MNKIKPTQTLPAIVAILDKRDSGEYGNAACPHCGALGRYVYTFVCEDGKRHGAMSGCIQLFPKSDSKMFKLMSTAYDKAQAAKEQKKNLASWWSDMIQAFEEFGEGSITLQDMYARVNAADSRRREWLNKNGYGKFMRRR